MPKRSSKKPKKEDASLAQEEEDQTAPDADETAKPEKNPAAVALGRLGGLKGGKARAEKLTKQRRSEIAKEAARARWEGQS